MNEDKQACNGWSISTLYTHFTAMLVAQKEAVIQAQSAADKAMVKAEGAAEKRFDSVNEFRATLSDQQRTLIPRAEAEVLFKAQDVRLAAMERILSENHGRNDGLSIGWSILLAVAGLGGMIFGLLKQ